MPTRFEIGYRPEPDVAQTAYWFAFKGSDLLVDTSSGRVSVPLVADAGSSPIQGEQPLFLGRLNGAPCFAVALGSQGTDGTALAQRGLRSLFGELDDALFAVALRAAHLLRWDATHRFCGRCGTSTVDHADERAKHCPACGLVAYPRISPAVIVAVRRGDRLLLARNARRSGRMFSILAGFVEVGETLEEAVQREVREEVGIEVRNVCYFGSQPWPFPDSLMLGFTAEHAAGEIRMDPSEIAEADWFRVDEFPEIPGRISISRALIDAFVAEQSSGSDPGLIRHRTAGAPR